MKNTKRVAALGKNKWGVDRFLETRIAAAAVEKAHLLVISSLIFAFINPRQITHRAIAINSFLLAVLKSPQIPLNPMLFT